jgi:hypothetical protein
MNFELAYRLGRKCMSNNLAFTGMISTVSGVEDTRYTRNKGFIEMTRIPSAQPIEFH